ncbi:MAG: nucleotidyltransferase family protein, partial [Ilumatobacteraceae bacterium]
MSESLVERLVLLGLVQPGEPVVADTATVAALLAAAPHEGTVALLGAAIDAGAVVVDDESRSSVEAAWTETMARCVQLDILLCSVSQRLAAAGVHHRVLKGAAVATLDEMQPAWRSYSDVDVLVPDGSLMAAVRVLAAGELRPIVQPVSERWAERHAKSLTLVAPDGTQVDLHRQLAPGVFGERLQLGVLFHGGAAVALGGAEVLALDAPHRFLHACYHASLGGVRGARHRRDILLLARSVTVGELAGRWAEGWSPTVVADSLQ